MIYSSVDKDLTLIECRGPFIVLNEKPTLPPPLLDMPFLTAQVLDHMQQFRNQFHDQIPDSDVSYLDNLLKGKHN